MLPLADVESSESILLLTESYNRSYGLQQLMSEFGKYFTSHTELQQKLGSQQLMLVVAFAEGQSLVKYFTSHSALQQKLQIAIVDACRWCYDFQKYFTSHSALQQKLQLDVLRNKKTPIHTR